MPSLTLPSGPEVYYTATGRGPELLQVHGSGLGHWNVSYLTAALAPHFTCIDIDMPGYGRSGPATLGGGIEELAEAVAQFISVRGGAPVNLHGTSFGGLVVIALAAKYPQLVDNLIVSAALIRPDGAARQRRQLWESTTAKNDPALYADLTIHCGFARPFFERADAETILADYHRAMADGAGTDEAYHDAAVSMQTVDMMRFLSEVHAPTLIIGGTDDVMTPLRPLGDGIGGARMAEAMANAELAEIPDAAHFVLIEAPDAVARHIRSFLTRTGPK